MKLISIIASLLFITAPSFAQDPPKHGPSQENLIQMAEQNSELASLQVSPLFADRSSVIPFHEYDKTGYLLMNDDDYYGMASKIKEIIAKNMPEDSTLIVYTRSSNTNYQKQLFSEYSQWTAPGKLKVLQIPTSGNGFWTRDTLPVPAWDKGQLTLVDARYYHSFEPDQFMSEIFGATLDQHSYFFEGGNFMANSRGECIVVNRKKAYPGGTSDTGAIPDSIFYNKYGCTKLMRFKHLKGIGHADEVIKFMSDDIVVTDTEEYVDQLEDAGYTVHLLPEPDRNYETYANALIVNDVLFVPVFGESGDQKALDIYKNLNLGFKIVPVPSRQLATQGQGGIHCITMNYPDVPLQDVAEALGGKLIEQ